MSKRTTVMLLVAAVVVVVAAIFLGRRAGQRSTPSGEHRPASTRDGNLADAFVGFVQAGTNWAAQWFVDKVGSGGQGGETGAKPPPLNKQGATVKAPVGATPNVVTSPTWFT